MVAVFWFTWLWVFLFMMWRGRAILAVFTLVILAVIMPPSHRIRIAAAESTAASTLRRAAQKLGEATPANVIPASADFEALGYPQTLRFYRFEYLPQHSSGDAKISGFLLKARPVRYECGCTASFTVASDGKIHMTQEDREATLNDPTLD